MSLVSLLLVICVFFCLGQYSRRFVSFVTKSFGFIDFSLYFGFVFYFIDFHSILQFFLEKDATDPLFLLQKFFMNKHLSTCWLLIGFRSSEVIVLDYFAQFHSCFQREDLLMCSLCHCQVPHRTFGFKMLTYLDDRCQMQHVNLIFLLTLVVEIGGYMFLFQRQVTIGLYSNNQEDAKGLSQKAHCFH